MLHMVSEGPGAARLEYMLMINSTHIKVLDEGLVKLGNKLIKIVLGCRPLIAPYLLSQHIKSFLTLLF